jgi:hypothetical protein
MDEKSLKKKQPLAAIYFIIFIIHIAGGIITKRVYDALAFTCCGISHFGRKKFHRKKPFKILQKTFQLSGNFIACFLHFNVCTTRCFRKS